MSELLPSDDELIDMLTTDDLVEIGRLSIRKHFADCRDVRSSDAHNAWVMRMSELGLLHEWE